MNWGVIGTGNMGSVLIDAWLTSGVVSQDNLWIHNRTLAKAFDIKDQYPSINVCTTPERVIKNADIIFITDGEASLSNTFIQKYNDIKKEKNFHLLSLIIGRQGNIRHIEQVSDRVVKIKNLNDEGSFEAFEI